MVVFKKTVRIKKSLQEFSLVLPKSASILRVDVQKTNYPNEFSLWYLVTKAEPEVERVFLLVGTGVRFDADILWYVGSFETEVKEIYHIFEIHKSKGN